MQKKVVAKPPTPVLATSGKSFAIQLDDLPLDSIELGEDVGKSAGWRLEGNSNGMTRWRWQMKDEMGKPITYITTSGKTGYKRGSKYVGK